jgi:flagellar basal body P-ring formation protein FlgA
MPGNVWRTAACVLTLVAVAIPMGVRAEDQNLPVPNLTIYPGDIIRADALDTRRFGPGAERLAVVRSAEAAVGRVARRTLLPQKPIPLNALRDVNIVQQGKSVKIVFASGGLVITGTGIALQSGVVGDTLNVRNVDSGMTVRGTAQADGTVRIEGP